MIVRVPKSVDVKSLLDPLNLSEVKKRNMNDKMYYLLSLLATDNSNYFLYQKNNGYKKISSELMKKKLGNTSYYEILKLLMNPNDPIIESDESWYNPKSNKSKGYCKGYRLTEKYNTGNLVFRTIPDKYDNKEEFNQSHSELEQQESLNSKYHYLRKEFQDNTLTFHPNVYECVSRYGKELMGRIDTDNDYQAKLVYNKVGRLLYSIDSLKSRISNVGISPTNHRFNSYLTGIRRLIRPYILCNGDTLTELDLISSQPYILSTIMSNKFIKDTEIGYNVHTIFNDLYEDLNQLIHDSNDNNRIDEYLRYLKYQYDINTISSNPEYDKHTSFMWCKNYTEDEQISINRFRHTSFTSDFYNECIRYAVANSISSTEKEIPTRDEFKKSMMFILFEKKQGHRQKNRNIQLFRELFPGVDRFIRDIHQIIGPEKFSLLLQRTESYLILDKACRLFKMRNPNAPIFTIHDAMLTNGDYMPELAKHTQETIQVITGKPIGYKVKTADVCGAPAIAEVERDMKKILSIKTRKQYETVAGEVFSTNIDNGKRFLDS